MDAEQAQLARETLQRYGDKNYKNLVPQCPRKTSIERQCNALDELTEIAMKLGLPKFTGKQLAEWLCQKDMTRFEDMTNLSKKVRALPTDQFIGSNPSGFSVYLELDLGSLSVGVSPNHGTNSESGEAFYAKVGNDSVPMPMHQSKQCAASGD